MYIEIFKNLVRLFDNYNKVLIKFLLNLFLSTLTLIFLKVALGKL